MPIYEYQCKACNARLEKLQKINDPVLKVCPECNEESLQKLVSATSFRLKGTGWYETDFKTGKKKHGAEDKSSTSGGTKESAGMSSKDDKGKPDGKTDAKSGKSEKTTSGASKTAGSES